MSPNARIVLNTIATYGRSVYSLALGLFSSRWILAALGKSDYGLFGVVGSIIGVIGFLNAIMSGAVGRYYAYAIGQESSCPEMRTNETVRRWFNAALLIHSTFAVGLCMVGYPVGLCAIRHWLVIPPDRVLACEQVFALSLMSAFVSMASVPFVAMYTARQLITELSIFGILQTSIMFCVAYWLLNFGGDKLVAYAIAATFLPVAILGVQIYRARRHFDACRVKREYLFDRKYISKLFSFAFWEFFASGGDLIRTQGTAFLINRNFGPTVNASWSLSSQVSTHTTSLSAAMIGAIAPALTTAFGSDNRTRMLKLTYATCKYGTFLILLFAVPLVLEMDYILDVWLVDPPPYASVLCRCMLIALICHKLAIGHHTAILADGRVAPLLSTTGLISASTILLVLWAIKAGYGALGIGLSFVMSYSLLTFARVIHAKILLGIPVWEWFARILIPIVFVTVFCFAVGYLPVMYFVPSFMRLLFTTMCSGMTAIILCWVLICTEKERAIFGSSAKKMYLGLLHH